MAGKPTGKPWLRIAAGTLVGLVVGAALGRSASRGPASPVGSARPETREGAADPALGLDTSGHRVRFVTVEPGVRLEVLDWGGDGPALALLAGLGDNAHVFDQFAYQFTDQFHVIGITRRGFGRSSRPAQGYDVATRARDIIRVLDALGIRAAVLVGHSLAGTELNRIGEAHPGRITKLVYLDALDLGWGGWAGLPQPPPAPDYPAADLESVQRLAAADARSEGYRAPLAAIGNRVRTDPSGRVVGPITPPGIAGKILEGLQQADYGRIQAPALGIFNAMTPGYRPPYYADLGGAQQAEYDRAIKPIAAWAAGAIGRFRSGLKGARVVELTDAHHYLFITEEAFVAREMRKFLQGP